MSDREPEIKESTAEDLQAILKKVENRRQQQLERVCADMVEQYMAKARNGRLGGVGGTEAIVSFPLHLSWNTSELRTVLIKKGWELASMEEEPGFFSFLSLFRCRIRMWPCKPRADGVWYRQTVF